MTTPFRMLTSAIALFAGLLTLASLTAAPSLPTSSFKKAAEANIAQLQKHLMVCDTDASKAKQYGPTAKTLAMMVALDAEALGDKALKEQALKVASAIAAKNYKGAIEAAKALTIKAGTAPLPAADLTKVSKFDLDEVMSAFRVEKVGGLNIEKDIRAIFNAKMMVNPADVEVLATRTAVLLDYTCAMPNDKAKTNKDNTAEWTKLSKDSIEITKKLSEEAAKGKGVNEKEIIKLLKGLDAKCSDCHNKYRE